MHIKTRNVNTAFKDLVEGIHTGRYPTEVKASRNGEVIVIEEPVIITYSHPRERVLFNQARDCNPFFHLYEALWMLAGRNDVAPLSYYNSQIKNYSDDGETFNRAYGYRWRRQEISTSRPATKEELKPYNQPSGTIEGVEKVDQLKTLIQHLKANPESRRAVLQMWTVEDDLLKIGGRVCDNCPPKYVAEENGFKHGQHVTYIGGVKHIVDCRVCKGTGIDPGSKDTCCNLSVMFSIRVEREQDIETSEFGVGKYEKEVAYLDMTVTNRSNDLIWGCLGANYVHFSFLQEYMAANIGVEVGVYNHFTNNLHVYTDKWEPTKWLADKTVFDEEYLTEIDKRINLIQDPEIFEKELPQFVEENKDGKVSMFKRWKEPFLDLVAQKACHAFHCYKTKDYEEALKWCKEIKSLDWQLACYSWIERRKK